MRLFEAVAACAALALLSAGGASAAARSEPKMAASGETQVVAKAGGREITLSELRAEMARLRLSFNDSGAERVALDSLVNRTLLAGAARVANLHRKPDAVLRIQAAQDQALADLYLGLAAQPPEPTPDEIEDFIAGNPSLFSDRRVYDFAVLTIPTDKFDEKSMSPLFDEEPNFDALVAALERAGAAYSIAGAAQPSNAFPKPVREQLARYTVADNIVIKGEAQTQIMKITRARREALPTSEWQAAARRLLIEDAAGARAERLVARLKGQAQIAYYRQSAAPAKAAPAKPTAPGR